MIAIVAGLGIGCGLVYLLDSLDTSLKQPERFESDLGVPIFATVPKIYYTKDIIWKKLNQVLTIFSVLASACLLAGFAVLVFYGVEPTIQTVRLYLTFLKI